MLFKYGIFPPIKSNKCIGCQQKRPKHMQTVLAASIWKMGWC